MESKAFVGARAEIVSYIKKNANGILALKLL